MFRYWFKHWLAFQKVARQHKAWKPHPLLHDIDKPFLGLLFNRKKVHKIHRSYSPHHLEYKGKKDYLSMVIDWECARYTKPDKPMSAKEYYYHIGKTLSDEDSLGIWKIITSYNFK